MNQGKIAIVVVALGAAGIIFWKTSSGGEALPDTQESETLWMCSENSCAHAFRLTAAACEKAEMRAGQQAPLHCQVCDKVLAYRAATCETCREKYFGADVPGSTGVCRKCYPQAPVQTPKRPVVVQGPDDEPVAVEEVPREMPAAKRKAPPAY